MCSRKIDADLMLVNEHETISYSHKCVESIEEMPKLKLVREGHSSPVIKHRKTSLLTCKNFNMVKMYSRPQQTNLLYAVQPCASAMIEVGVVV
jgi:hypothetical protein